MEILHPAVSDWFTSKSYGRWESYILEITKQTENIAERFETLQ